MGRRPSRRRLRPAAWLAALALTAGCGILPGQRVGPASGDPRAGAILVQRLNEAVHDRKPLAFLSNFAGGADVSRAAVRWYRFMTQTDATIGVPPGGSLLEVTWTLPGDDEPATTPMLTALGSRDGQPVITGVREDDVTPIWIVDIVDITHAGRGTLISAGASSDVRVTRAAQLDRAAEAVMSARVISPKAHWHGGLVVEEPADAGDFTILTGYDVSDTAGLTGCAEGTPRIVLNPVLDESAVEATLVHEAVHVATDSPCGYGADWAVEGLAEWVAGTVYPDVADDNRTAVKEYLKENGVPQGLPTSVTSVTDYALATVAVDQIFAHLSHDKAVALMDRFVRTGSYDDVDEERVTPWYLAELERLVHSG